MKKIFALFLVAVMALSFSSAFAQETAEDVITLSMETVGTIFSWDNTNEEIEEFLAGIEGLEYEVEEDEDGVLTITAEVDLVEEYDMYCFYFDPETRELFEIEAFTTFSDSYDASDIMQYLMDAYGFENYEEYTDNFIEEYLADFEMGTSIADDGTIVIIGGNMPTEESEAVVGMTFMNRVWYEAE